MPKFSKRSEAKLNTVHVRLRAVMNELIEFFDITVIDGIRDEETQNEYYRTGESKVKWPNSKHNSKDPTKSSRAIDIAPWIPGRGIDWSNHEHFHFMAGLVLALGHKLGVKIRWGGDWNLNMRSDDEIFADLGHFELDE